MRTGALIATCALLLMAPAAQARSLTDKQANAALQAAGHALAARGEQVVNNVATCDRVSAKEFACGVHLERPGDPGAFAAVPAGQCFLPIYIKLRGKRVTFELGYATGIHMQGACAPKS